MQSRRRFMAAFEGESVDRVPVWFMRQAGRYLPGYRAVRAEHGFWDVCKDPALSTKVALEPLAKFPAIDAAIVFSDILVVQDALGLGVSFEKGDGPKLARPLRQRADLDQWNRAGLMERLAFLPRAVRHLREAIGGERALLGFAGAPFTLLCYAVDGGSSDDFRLTRTMLCAEPKLAEDALAILADAVSDLLIAQHEAGADAVQLFDTWGGLLSRDDYVHFALPALRRITDRLQRASVPSLLFVRGGQHLLPVLASANTTGLSLDWRSPFAEARELLPNLTLQGNLDPVTLFADPAHVAKRTQSLLDEMRRSSHSKRCIFNLGHGILPGTPEASLSAICDTLMSDAAAAR